MMSPWDLQLAAREVHQLRGPQAASAAAAKAAQQAHEDVLSDSLDKKQRRRAKRRAFVKKSIEKQRVFLKTPFTRVCKELLPDGFCVGDEAIDCLQQAAEAAVEQAMREAYIVATHAKKCELYPRDIRVLKKLRPTDV